MNVAPSNFPISVACHELLDRLHQRLVLAIDIARKLVAHPALGRIDRVVHPPVPFLDQRRLHALVGITVIPIGQMRQERPDPLGEIGCPSNRI